LSFVVCNGRTDVVAVVVAVVVALVVVALVVVAAAEEIVEAVVFFLVSGSKGLDGGFGALESAIETTASADCTVLPFFNQFQDFEGF